MLFTFPKLSPKACRLLGGSLRFFGAAAILAAWLAAHSWAVDWRRLDAVAAERYGDSGTTIVARWQALLSANQDVDTMEQLRAVNEFFNRTVRWTSDIDLFGQSDYWATPLEAMALGAGDCEDFSIAKYITLLSLGVPAEQMRLVYVKAQGAGTRPQAHMVLAWYRDPTAVPLILDNLNGVILPADERRDLVPVFSFNHTDLWLGAGGQRSNADPRARMARWQRVLNRAQADGMTIDD